MRRFRVDFTSLIESHNLHSTKGRLWIKLFRSGAGEENAREELAVLLLVEPGALDVEQLETRDEARKREGVASCAIGLLVRASGL